LGALLVMIPYAVALYARSVVLAAAFPLREGKMRRKGNKSA
jgi:hypothetical protein